MVSQVAIIAALALAEAPHHILLQAALKAVCMAAQARKRVLVIVEVERLAALGHS